MYATFAVPLLAGLYWRRATREGAFASMALGLGASLVFGGISYFKLASLPMHFSFYAFVIAIISMIVVSFMTKPTSEKVLDETLTGFYIRQK
jgi:SSS family solute:Na+ symporter